MFGSKTSWLFFSLLCVAGCAISHQRSVTDAPRTDAMHVTLRKPSTNDEKHGARLPADAENWQSKLRLQQPCSNVYSGSEPKSDAAFQAIAKLGVQTIVSVDGVRPDVEGAAKHGLRYVHIPIGYDGIDADARLSLVRLAAAEHGVCYVHCHHGRHRGPAAAAIVCRVRGSLDSQTATDFLRLAGTDPIYTGLYRDVAKFEMPAANETLPQLKSVQEVGDLAEQMASIDRIFDRIADSPDPKPQDTVLLYQTFREAARQLRVASNSKPAGQDNRLPADPDLLSAMDASTQLAKQLHKNDPSINAAEIVGQLQANCTSCHARHRDN